MSALWRIVLMRFWRSLSGILACNPNPVPSVKGCVCLVGSASCRSFWHTRPASVPGLLSGAAAPATLLGASPQTPFYLYKEVYRQAKTSAKWLRSVLFIILLVFSVVINKHRNSNRADDDISDKAPYIRQL